MVITHQKNLGKPPKWISIYQQYLENFHWIKIKVIYGGNEPTLKIKYYGGFKQLLSTSPSKR
jgi:hypothetical protein